MTLRPVKNFFHRSLLAGALFGMVSMAHAFEPFLVEEIRVEGLQRISAGTVFNYLPIKQGERIDESGSAEAIRALFRTGFFKDVVLEREGNTLVVFVAERPAIASIDIKGNAQIPSDQLLPNLAQLGLAEGRVFDRALLDKVEQELNRQYLALGKYGAKVSTSITPLERNRVAIRIDIAEGDVATITEINLIGNQVFSDDELLRRFELDPRPFPIFDDSDQYSRQKLSGDLEMLRSFYLDRGYINFNIVSTQVSITPDKQEVYITVNVDEGEQFQVSEVRLAGDTIMTSDEVLGLIRIKAGEVFSQRRVTESSAAISDRLGELGYAFANVNPVPEVDEATQQVKLTFFVDPGKRVYVRRINISGNIKTQDEVLRREMRQMEGAPLETARVSRSRTRLNRLGFFESVNIETPVVPGSPDQVDVNVDVIERDAFGSLNVGIGYGEVNGFLVNASVTQANFLGTGQRFSLNFNNSQVNTEYGFSFTDPYHTIDGVSRTISAFYRSTDAEQANIATYTTDAYGAGVNYGVPLSEFNTFRYGFNVEHTRINTTTGTSPSILEFCLESAPNADCSFDAFKTNASWSYDSRDRAIFPTSGSLQSLGGEVALPGGGDSISFYKLQYRHRKYMPLTQEGGLVLLAGGELTYADRYGDSPELPPFEKYYAGGQRTVRGYRPNSLGPRDANGDPLGGNSRVVANMELIFPPPFTENNNSLRLSAFVDGGNVFDTSDGINADELRYSTGVSMAWITPIGALTFSVARALNEKPGDETESFQFNLGAPF